MSDQDNAHFPFEIVDVDPEELRQITKLFEGTKTDFVRIGPKGYLFQRAFAKYAADIYNMPVRQSDTIVASYQRSGTTWTQELVWLVANNLDYTTAKSISLTQRYPFLEFISFLNPITMQLYLQDTDKSDQSRKTLETLATPATKLLANAPDPRFIKTHLPLSLLPPKALDTAKIVYVARDPRDVAVSCYHHTKLFVNKEYTVDFKQYWHAFTNNLYTFSPYFEHVKESWAQRHHPNMLFLFYEELSKDLPTSIRRVTDFLGKELTAEEIHGLCNHLNIDNFRKNKSVNFEELRDVGMLASDETFIRKGKVGGWRDYFDSDMTQQAERWIADNLWDTDLRFPSMENELFLITANGTPGVEQKMRLF